MEQDRIEPAVQRIEAALARIAAVADAVPAPRGDSAGAAESDSALRERVAAALADLDELIGQIEA
ncbi:MAG: hypothetical protein KJZ64_00600 [Sphingomonadaceae bacterium]|nr:hypothetical protein [Sphingomonadaceae bacterium]